MAPVPDDEPVGPSTPPPPPSPPRRKTPIAAALAAAPFRVDDFLSHLSRCMQTRAGADVVLLFLCYSSRLGGSVLEALSRPILRHSARRLVALAFKLPPATTLVLSATTPQPPVAAFAFRLGGRLKALAALISETRTMGRLWGLLSLYFAAKKLVIKSCAAAKQPLEKTHDDEHVFDTVVAYAQVMTLISFQATENAAYLASKNILPLSTATQARLSMVSVRSWGLYVGMELGRLLVERSRRTNSAKEAVDAKWAADWTKNFKRSLSWAPLTVHWGMRNGPLPDMLVSLLAAYPSTGAMMDLWRETA